MDVLPTLMVEFLQSDNPWTSFRTDKRFASLHPIMEKILCVLATSAPVERVFSHGGLFMRPNRARMGQKRLGELVFSKCNKHVK